MRDVRGDGWGTPRAWDVSTARFGSWIFETGAARVVGAHDDGAVSAVEYDDATKKLFTFGWDRTIRAWDLTKDERGRAGVDDEDGWEVLRGGFERR